MTSLKDYYLMLSLHDWQYHKIADNTEGYKKADKNHFKLQRISNESPEHLALYLAWESYGLTGDPELKPNRPGEQDVK